MGRHVRRRPLVSELTRRHPSLHDPRTRICAGEILVNGIARTNPASHVAATDTITIRTERQLRGSPKLAHALDAFAVPVRGRVAIDIGAAAGGFTQVLPPGRHTRLRSRRRLRPAARHAATGPTGDQPGAHQPRRP